MKKIYMRNPAAFASAPKPVEENPYPQKDGSFHELLQSSTQNIPTYTTQHQNSFEIEENMNASHSPISRHQSYMASSFQQKPFTADNNFEMNRMMTANPAQRYAWPNTAYMTTAHGFYHEGYAFPQGANLWSAQGAPHPQTMNIQEHTQFPDHHDMNAQNPHLLMPMPMPMPMPMQMQMSIPYSSNYSQLYNESSNGFLIDRSKHRRFSNPMSSKHHNYNNFVDMDEEVNHDLHSMPHSFEHPAMGYSKAQHTNHSLLADYENFSESIKPDATENSTPEKRHHHLGFDSFYNSMAGGNRSTTAAQGTKNNNNNSIANYLIGGDSLNSDSLYLTLNGSKPAPITPSSKEYLDQENDQDDLLDDQGYGSNYGFEGASDVQNNKNSVANPSGGAESQGIASSQACICNCKKTRCLKLYCECFARLGFCGEGCHCHSCKNRPDYEDERQMAINEAKQRNPDAFLTKATTEVEQQNENSRKAATESLKKGCNCRRTKCLKKYCECFNAGAYCSHLCKCESCENHERSLSMQRLGSLQQGQSGGFFTTNVTSALTASSTTAAAATTTTATTAASTTRPSSSQSNFIQRQLSFPTAASQKLGIIGLQKFPLTLQSYQSQLRNGHTHGNLLGFVQKESETPSQEERNSSYYPTTQSTTTSYQRKLIFDGDNEDSEPVSGSNNSLGTNLNKAKLFKKKISKQKQNIKQSPGSHSGGEDEGESFSQQQQQQSGSEQRLRYAAKRANKAAAAASSSEAVLKTPKNNEELLMQQQLEDMEKKLKQIQQMQQILHNQQQLQQEKAKIMQSSSDILSTPANKTTNNQIAPESLDKSLSMVSPCPSAIIEEKTLELKRQKEELKQSLLKEHLESSAKKQNSLLTPSNNNNSNRSNKGTAPEHSKAIQKIKKFRLQQNNSAADDQEDDSGSEEAGAAIPTNQSNNNNNNTSTAQAISHSETNEDEVTSSADNPDSESKQSSENQNPKSAQTQRLSKSQQHQLLLQSSLAEGVQEMTVQNMFSLQDIAATAKPSEMLYDPSSYSMQTGLSFDNFPRHPSQYPVTANSFVKHK